MQEPELGYDDDGIIEVNIPLAQLLLDEANFRIEEVDSQQRALEALIRQQGERKVLNLAEHIVKHGRLTPGERLMVIRNDISDDDDESYIVMEGNRRTMILKLLEEPDLIQVSSPRLYQQFLVLSKHSPKRLVSGVPCSLVPDRETALQWIAAKHSTGMDGIGVEKWDALATARFAEQMGQFRRWRIALARLEAAGINTVAIRQGIEKKTTAVDRVLSNRDVRENLGLVFHEGQGTLVFDSGDEKAGLALLQQLMEAMAEPSFRTATVHSLKDRTAFVLAYLPYSVKKIPGQDPPSSPPRTSQEGSGEPEAKGQPSQVRETNGIPGQGKTVPGQGQQKLPGKHPLRKLVERKSLAPTRRDQTFHIKDAVLNELYIELRGLSVKNFEKTAGVMTRVFLEMSCDAYLEHFEVPLPDFFAKRSIRRWRDARLKEKVEAVLRDVDPTRRSSALDPVRKALGGDDWLHSIDTLHDFVHGRLASVTEQEVKTIWDRWHPFFEGLHNELSGG